MYQDIFHIIYCFSSDKLIFACTSFSIAIWKIYRIAKKHEFKSYKFIQIKLITNLRHCLPLNFPYIPRNFTVFHHFWFTKSFLCTITVATDELLCLKNAGTQCFSPQVNIEQSALMAIEKNQFWFCHGCQTFILAEIHCYLSALKSWHNN